MSWQLASFLLVGAVLVGGFAWYERSRPSSQVVALVAALAALAVAGRVAFAALPNVVATTDIVVFAGYGLGAAPGFAVGALAGLVANFWLGQGPWTPWQMAGWGACGALGALLALGVPNAGRLALAATCGLAALFYGALLNFSVMATYGGELSMQRFLALESAAAPFEVAHVAGNVTLALLAGPAMVRMLVRFRERFQWRATATAAALLTAVAVAAAAPSPAAADTDAAARWLVSQQNADGGWGASPERASSPDMTAWAMLGLEAAGRNPLDVRSRRGRTPVDFLRANLGQLRSSGDFARTILALQGAGVDPRSFGGRNLVAALLRRRRASGSFEGWPVSTAFGVMALRQAGATGGLRRSLAWLAGAQNADGGWGALPDSSSTPDGTGAVMQAMPSSDVARRGLSYLRRAQRRGGGFALGGTGKPNSQSTAWAVQGMIAVGADPERIRRGGRSPLDYLAARQAPDGHYRYSRSSDQTPIWVTGQVLAAVAGKAFPIAPVRRRPVRRDVPSRGSGPERGSGGAARGGGAPSLQDVLRGVEEGRADAARGEGVGGGLPRGTGRAAGKGPPPAAPRQPGAGLGALTPPGGGGIPGVPRLGSPEAEEQPPVAAPAELASGEGREPEPLSALGVGVGVGSLALAAVVVLGRRYGW